MILWNLVLQKTISIEQVIISPPFHLLSNFLFLQPWSELGNKLAETSVAISLVEKEVLQMLRLEVSV